MVPRMTIRRTVAGTGLWLTALMLAGCANGTFRWIEGPPAAPGSGLHSDPSVVSQAPATTSKPDTAAPIEPFAPEQRQRITLVEPWVEQAAREHQLDPALIHGVIWVESRHQPRAKSPAGARGLMQLMPATANAMARKMGRSRARVYDPEFNVMAGSLYLAKLTKRYEGDQRLALAAYNAGSGNVDRWLREDGELPPRSVRYVELVMDARRRFEARRDGAPAATSKQTIVASAEEPPALVPEPPPPAPSQPRTQYTDTELGVVPRYVAVPPEPGANDEPPPVEPPLADTPYPPNDDDFAPSRPVATAPAAAPSQPPAKTDTPARVEPATSDSPTAPPPGLPGVLD